MRAACITTRLSFVHPGGTGTLQRSRVHHAASGLASQGSPAFRCGGVVLPKRPARVGAAVSAPVHSVGVSRRALCCAVESASSPSSPMPASAGDAQTKPVFLGLSRKRLKVGFWFFMWYLYNVVFNIVNKKTLNMWSYPWVLSTIQLGVGALYVSVLWLLGLRRRPQVNGKLIRSLILPSLFHTIGHATSCLSFSSVAISFTHTVKSAEPVVGALGSALFLHEYYSPMVYFAMIPIIVGVALSSISELTFTMAGFLNAMASNFAFVARNVTSKVSLGDTKKDASLTAFNTYGLITIISFFLELPMALLFEGLPKVASRIPGIGAGTVFGYIAVASLLYHLYNEASYGVLEDVSPLTFSIGNVVKRLAIILSSVIAFGTIMRPLNWLGVALAVGGTLIYSYAKHMDQKKIDAAKKKAA
ncbi:probable glucose 6 phosphate/phosphate translocator [Cyanidioschyzon merolae strain 10D]|jgi:solute carrier family 35 protein E1|uniref:Probable glucose 6 phosphate/phosphate translocator n=1 Tax=Cyanidioschyzon merolae (strain NIES-3377 / 10D) TaxID=280699 RepID=M1V611_CYAM1|nr:probable glucose 6 phosphate/phosphate translocator [Cyanidioschyzon merolae strain 10D]BAM81610.1 probable glucose 6 phosphate/phosphate translocator [Cyanidioschyzon merolae strain 10D]|eukprot:XP_005537646.1 probable glucose 6 phosphate/phosphate translocator [Cyanidioschyzon merolae strain 10D]